MKIVKKIDVGDIVVVYNKFYLIINNDCGNLLCGVEICETNDVSDDDLCFNLNFEGSDASYKLDLNKIDIVDASSKDVLIYGNIKGSSKETEEYARFICDMLIKFRKAQKKWGEKLKNIEHLEPTEDAKRNAVSNVINNEEAIKTPQKKNKKETIPTIMNSLPRLTKKWSRDQLCWFRSILDKHSASELATICAEMPDKWIRSTHSHKKYLINRLDEDTKYYYYLDCFISRFGNSNVVTKIDVQKDLPHYANYIDHSTAKKLFKAVKDMGIEKVSNYVNNFGYLELLQLYADLLLEYSFINPKDYSKNELTYIIGKKEKNVNVKNRAIGEAMRRGIYDRIVKKLKNRSYEYYEYLFADEKGE